MQVVLTCWTDFAENVKALNRKDYIIKKQVTAVISLLKQGTSSP